MKQKLTFHFYLFLILIFVLLSEGIFSAYYYKISYIIDYLPYKSNSSINPIVWNENGLVEILQNILLLLSIFFILKFILEKQSSKKDLIFIIFIYVYFFGLIYYFLEEVSWGQHIFFWDSPEFFLKTNNQSETNLHNISNIFNELPRSLLLIWCSFSFMISYFKLKNEQFLNFKNFIFPNKDLKNISYLLILFVAPDLIVDKFNLHPGYPIDWTIEIRFYEIIDVITFNYIRLSELHELIFDYYILCHSYYLIKNDHLGVKTKLEGI